MTAALAVESWGVALSGGIGSVFARVAVYPVDVLRTLQAVDGAGLQLNKLRLQDLYRGLGPGDTSRRLNLIADSQYILQAQSCMH
eukprot:SAG31_NODE_2455_length_5664_cov_1.921294_8_plen_85_part_00